MEVQILYIRDYYHHIKNQIEELIQFQ